MIEPGFSFCANPAYAYRRIDLQAKSEKSGIKLNEGDDVQHGAAKCRYMQNSLPQVRLSNETPFSTAPPVRAYPRRHVNGYG